MISTNFNKGNPFETVILKNEEKKVNTLLNDLFKDNKDISNVKLETKNFFTDPQAEFSKYAQLAKNSTDLGNINPNQMNFQIGG